MKLFQTSSVETIIKYQKYGCLNCQVYTTADRIYNQHRKIESIEALFNNSAGNAHINEQLIVNSRLS
jgi:hypothetical protein